MFRRTFFTICFLVQIQQDAVELFSRVEGRLQTFSCWFRRRCSLEESIKTGSLEALQFALTPPNDLIEILERVINVMGITLYGTNALCMAMLALSADKWEGTSRAKTLDTVILIVQLVILLGEWPKVDGDLVQRSVGISGIRCCELLTRQV